MTAYQSLKVPRSKSVSCKQSKYSSLLLTLNRSVLFDPNEIVEDNSMVAMIVKQNVNLL